MQIKYEEKDGNYTTPCPYDMLNNLGTVMIGSLMCRACTKFGGIQEEPIYEIACLKPEADEKRKFFQWLDGIVAIDCRTDRFYEAAWKEAQQANAEGRSFELSARYTLIFQPYLYRLS